MAEDQNRCWPGYEPVPGKKPHSQGSCKPKAESKSSPSEKDFRAKRRKQLDNRKAKKPGSRPQSAQHMGPPAGTGPARKQAAAKKKAAAKKSSSTPRKKSSSASAAKKKTSSSTRKSPTGARKRTPARAAKRAPAPRKRAAGYGRA